MAWVVSQGLWKTFFQVWPLVTWKHVKACIACRVYFHGLVNLWHHNSIGELVIVQIILFGIMCVDRVVYSGRHLKTKFVMQLSLTLFYCIGFLAWHAVRNSGVRQSRQVNPLNIL